MIKNRRSVALVLALYCSSSPPGAWSFSVTSSGPMLWRRAELDYSAANEYIQSHYYNNDNERTAAFRQPYFDHTAKDGKCVEEVYNGRRGFWDDSLQELVEPSLERCGFELRHAPIPSSLTDYEDLEQIESIYLPHLRNEVIPKAFSDQQISDVIFWHPMYRGDDQVIRGDLSSNQQKRLPTACIAPLAHIDTDIGAFDEIEQVARLVGKNRVNDAPQAESFQQSALEAALRSGRRFCIVNLWRNADFDNPIRRAPLAVLATWYPVLGQPSCFPNAKPDRNKSRWYTFPSMSKDECLLFLQYDRDIQQPSDVWHCALATVQEEDCEARTRSRTPRRSFDVRALVVFDENVPPDCDRFAEGRTRPFLTRQESECFCEDQSKTEGKKVEELVEKLKVS